MLRATLSAIFLCAMVAPLVAEEVLAGSKPLTRDAAAGLFAQVCLATRPDLKKAETVLEGLGYVPRPSTGTFFDGVSNVSFQLSSENMQCSMVFMSESEPLEVVMFLALVGGEENVQVDPNNLVASSSLSDGAKITAQIATTPGYFHAVVQSPNPGAP